MIDHEQFYDGIWTLVSQGLAVNPTFIKARRRNSAAAGFEFVATYDIVEINPNGSDEYVPGPLYVATTRQGTKLVAETLRRYTVADIEYETHQAREARAKVAEAPIT